MNNIWSSNKYVNLAVNVLLFLVGINFLHYGQLILPIICFILFIDNKFRFYVNDKKIFIILCLFAISFFAFSYEQGFYCVMGFCLPMAYYIGSNIKEVNKDNIKKVIYLISFGMILHVILNFGVDIVTNGWHLFYSSSHYDIWVPEKVSSTATAMNTLPFISFLYYVTNYEKNKTIKSIYCVCFILFIIYSFGLGQRTIYFMIIISLFAAYLLDCIIFKNKKVNKKLLIRVVLALFVVVMIFILCYFTIPGFQKRIDNTRIFVKFFNLGIGTNRFSIFLDTVQLMPYHLWGGNEISNIVGLMPHDLWLDVYDWAGIIPFIFMVTHTIMFVVVFVKFIKNNKITNQFKILIIPLFVCIGIQMFLEPVMSGASLFLIVVIIFEALLEKLNNYE